MKVILLDNIKGVGKKDEVIDVNDGYARNFLIPKKKAVEANNSTLSTLKSKQDSKEHQRQVEKEEAIKIKDKLSKIMLTLKVKAGGNGKIFGGITSKEIADSLEENYKIKIDKKKIELKDTIKSLGAFNVKIRLFQDVIGELKINIVAD